MRFLRDGTHDRSFYGPLLKVFRTPDACTTRIVVEINAIKLTAHQLSHGHILPLKEYTVLDLGVRTTPLRCSHSDLPFLVS